MRLSDFILDQTEPILAEWEAFAHDIWPAPASTDPAELRDHAEAILRATVADMGSDQTAAEQAAKSKGHGVDDAASRKLDTASHHHGAGRVESGFRIAELVAEYRALRGSVIRLWHESRPDPDPHDLDDVTRFHESIDQSLARAVQSYTERIDQARRLFLAILGHDLRAPLAAIKLTADVLSRTAAGDAEQRHDLVDRATGITASADAMDAMIADLLDFTAGGLGSRMPISRARGDLDAICRDAVRELGDAHPHCTVDYEVQGETVGQWDCRRLRQVLSNLLTNAAKHGVAADDQDGGGSGQPACDITVHLRGRREGVTLTIHNGGPPIPPHALPTLFDPLRRIATEFAPGDTADSFSSVRVGLGLYIVHQIVTAHGGTIDVSSTAADGTTFTLHLPRGGERDGEGSSR